MAALVDRFKELDTHKKATLTGFSLVVLLAAVLGVNTLSGPDTTPQDAVYVQSQQWSNINYATAGGGGKLTATVKAPSHNAKDIELEAYVSGSTSQKTLTMSPGETQQMSFQVTDPENSELKLRYAYKNAEGNQKSTDLKNIPSTPISTDLSVDQIRFNNPDDRWKDTEEVQAQLEIANQGDHRIEVVVLGTDSGLSSSSYYNNGWLDSYYSTSAFVTSEENSLKISPGQTETIDVELRVVENVDSPPSESKVDIPIGIYHGEITEAGRSIRVYN